MASERMEQKRRTSATPLHLIPCPQREMELGPQWGGSEHSGRGLGGVIELLQSGFVAQTSWPRLGPAVCQWFLMGVKTFRDAGFGGPTHFSGKLLNFIEREAGEIDFPISVGKMEIGWEIPKATRSGNKRWDQPFERSSPGLLVPCSHLSLCQGPVSLLPVTQPLVKKSKFCVAQNPSHPQSLGEPRHENLNWPQGGAKHHVFTSFFTLKPQMPRISSAWVPGHRDEALQRGRESSLSSARPCRGDRSRAGGGSSAFSKPAPLLLLRLALSQARNLRADLGEEIAGHRKEGSRTAPRPGLQRD